MSKFNIKEKIAEMFLKDAGNYLKRYDILCQDSLNDDCIGMRCKLFVELLLAAECCIKGMIALESTDNENITYDKVFDCNLNELLNMLNVYSPIEKNNCVNYIDHKLLDYSIDIRYTLEARKQFRPDGPLSKEYYDIIVNFNWCKSVHGSLKELSEYIKSKLPTKSKPIDSIENNVIEGLENLEEWEVLKNIGKHKGMK